MFSLIAAIAYQPNTPDYPAIIGYQNKLPWKLKSDLAYFKNKTLNKTILMGRKTFESIGRPLPQRKNIVLTHQKKLLEGLLTTHADNPAMVSEKNIKSENISIETQIEAILKIENAAPNEEIFIIGGEQIYKLFLPYAKRLYLTRVYIHPTEILKGDAYFPKIDLDQWRLTSEISYPKDINNDHDYAFTEWSKD